MSIVLDLFNLLLAMILLMFMAKGYLLLFQAAFSNKSNRLDTPGKKIDRLQEQYLNDEITLEEYEDKVYDVIPVGWNE